MAELIPVPAEVSKQSQATRILEIVQGRDGKIFRSQTGEAFAAFGSRTFQIKSETFKNFLANLFYEASDTVAGAHALSDAVNTLCGRALFQADQEKIYCRIAHWEGQIVLDLANDPQLQVLVISKNGCEVTDRSPVNFVRHAGMQPLPPPQHGCKLADELKPFINSSPDDFDLVIAFLLSTLQPGGAYPILQISGEQGSSKTSVAKLIRLLIDPNEAPARGPARSERDVAISAGRSFVQVFDNLSTMPEWFSDCLCRMSTGQAFATRALYQDSEEKVFALHRPVILNGIGELSTRSDLVDRSLSIHLPRIEPTKRRTEQEFWTAFEEARPRILGGLVDVAAKALRDLHTVESGAFGRMSDFCRWIIAAESALGWKPGKFMALYNKKRMEAESAVLEESLVAELIVQFMHTKRKFWGTATELRNSLLTHACSVNVGRDPRFPSTANALSSAVARLAPALRTVGLKIERGRTQAQRWILIEACQSG